MVKLLVAFCLGIYVGTYVCQNYEIPAVQEPGKIVKRIKEIADEYRKK